MDTANPCLENLNSNQYCKGRYNRSVTKLNHIQFWTSLAMSVPCPKLTECFSRSESQCLMLPWWSLALLQSQWELRWFPWYCRLWSVDFDLLLFVVHCHRSQQSVSPRQSQLPQLQLQCCLSVLGFLPCVVRLLRTLWHLEGEGDEQGANVEDKSVDAACAFVAFLSWACCQRVSSARNSGMSPRESYFGSSGSYGVTSIGLTK